MKNHKTMIYLLVGIIAYEGDEVLFAFKNKKYAESKLDSLKVDEEKFGYSSYEIQEIELIETSTMN